MTSRPELLKKRQQLLIELAYHESVARSTSPDKHPLFRYDGADPHQAPAMLSPESAVKRIAAELARVGQQLSELR